MTDETSRPSLAAVPDPPDESADTDADGAADPLLVAAERIGELPLPERPAALERLNAALVEELNALEEV